MKGLSKEWRKLCLSNVSQHGLWIQKKNPLTFNELLSEKIHLKEEIKSELAEPGQVQVNTFEPFADVKDEISVEDHTDGQLEPCFKEDNKFVKGMEEAVFVKCEPAWPLDTEEEPSNFDSDELLSQKIHLKEEIKSELAEPGQVQVNTLEPFADVKDEISVEDHTDGQLEPCFKEDNKKQTLHGHNATRTEDGPLSSEVPDEEACGERSRDKYDRQMLIHTGERPYRCDICPKTFGRKSNLRRHMVTHADADNRPYCCDVCGKKFCRNNDLRAHIHIHAGEYPHQCKECCKNFREMSDLNFHMHTHTQERLNCCKICGKIFRRKSNLGRHMLIHEDVRPHSCRVCGKRFRVKYNLSAHMLIHSAESTTLL
ncbi:zinc finger protein 382 isoform X3 [Anabrus simplex]|uniref:zinc finger protein 382 isoform X3 n=1 Tax=Anabrus simplex TaxID=316456 RepID=UPI0035A2A6EE